MNVRKRAPEPTRGTFKNAATQPTPSTTQAKGIPNAVSMPKATTSGCIANTCCDRTETKKGKRG